jgi:hypothetical protein
MHAHSNWTRQMTSPIPERDLLPTLERDGKTVRIESNRDFQRIFEGHLSHGLLPVRAEGLKARQRRTLRFRICGLDLNIELKARVRSVKGGVAILVIQELERHRYLLASLAGDMPILV